MSFIVAEIGVNWEGDFELLDNMISNCKAIGCNAVKFQSYNLELIKGHPQKERLMKSTISRENIEEIDLMCRYYDMEWFCTPMYEDAVSLLEPFVKRIKIREYDARVLLHNKTTKLLELVLQTNKEIIASSEVSPKKSIFYNKVKWLYCVPKYPCSLSDLNFKHLNDFDGYSNHCPEIIAPLTASILGSKIIEIHITSSKSKDYIDNPVSFDYSELSSLVSYIRLSEKINT